MIPKKYNFTCIQGSRSIENYASPLFPNMLLTYHRGEGWFLEKLENNRRISQMVIIESNPSKAIKSGLKFFNKKG